MTLTDGTSAGQLTTTFSGHILVNASINVDASAASTEEVFCHLQISSNGGPFTTISKSTDTDIPASSRAEIPLTGGATEPPGTYNLRVECLRNGPDPGASFYAGDMTAVAAAS